MFSSKMFVLISMALAAAIIAADAQTPPSCASKLVPCAPYLGTPRPPAECCDPLREAITNDLDCLCKLYANPTLLPALGINITQALALPKACNIPGDISACGKGAPGPSSQALPPPATPGGNGNNAVNKFTWSGMSILLVLCASLMVA